MFLATIAAFLLLQVGASPVPASPPTPPLSAEGAALIEPVRRALQLERDRQAALPTPEDDREQLVRMGALDQAGRREIVRLNFTSLPVQDRRAAMQVANSWISDADAENERALLAMIPPEGWFLRSRYGEEAASAAFHIIQHSNIDLWRRFVPVLEPLVARGEVDGQEFGLMFDRLARSEGRPQRYGTQMHCVAGRWEPEAIEPGDVEARRRAAGFPISFADYLAYYATQPPCLVTERS